MPSLVSCFHVISLLPLFFAGFGACARVESWRLRYVEDGLIIVMFEGRQRSRLVPRTDRQIGAPKWLFNVTENGMGSCV